MKLYDLELSGNCYKVRLFLSLIEKEYELTPVDFLAGEHKQAPLIELNPFGEIPILVDDQLVLRDAQAILVYLASKYASDGWLPSDPAEKAQVVEWLMVAENEIARGPNDARLHDLFSYELDHATAVKISTKVLDLFEQHLSKNSWLATDRVTIADIACFPYLALGHQGRVPIGERPNIHEWISRIKAMNNFIAMPGL